MSISSLPVSKFQFPWAREEERDPRDQKIAALTAALQASLARESASRQANVELLRRQHTLALEFEHRFANGLRSRPERGRNLKRNNLRQTNYTILCGEIKLLIDGFCGERFPAIDFAHVGLAGSK